MCVCICTYSKPYIPNICTLLDQLCIMARERQAKLAAADPSSKATKGEATAEPAMPSSQHAHTHSSAAVLSTDVEDSQLPGFAQQPPPADPIGTGLLTSQQLSGTSHSYRSGAH